MRAGEEDPDSLLTFIKVILVAWCGSASGALVRGSAGKNEFSRVEGEFMRRLISQASYPRALGTVNARFSFFRKTDAFIPFGSYVLPLTGVHSINEVSPREPTFKLARHSAKSESSG
jgi:hypothetical protein